MPKESVFISTVNEDNDRLEFLDNVRAVAIIMVVGVHTLGYSLQLSSTEESIIDFIVHSISVPIFFFVDGFLLARRNSKGPVDKYSSFLKKSSFRLLLPWLVFSLLYTISRYLFETFGGAESNIVIGASFSEVIVSIYGSVYSGQMYFLLSLFIIRLFYPVTIRFFVSSPLLLQLAILCTYMLLFGVNSTALHQYFGIKGGQEPILHALWGLQFYLLGCTILNVSNRIDLNKLFFPSLSLFLFLLVADIQADLFEPVIVQSLYLLSLILFFSKFSIDSRFLRYLGRNTMGIYLLHVPVVMKTVSLLTNSYINVPLLSYFTILLFSLVASVLLVAVINSLPYGRILFGVPYGRSR